MDQEQIKELFEFHFKYEDIRKATEAFAEQKRKQRIIIDKCKKFMSEDEKYYWEIQLCPLLYVYKAGLSPVNPLIDDYVYTSGAYYRKKLAEHLKKVYK